MNGLAPEWWREGAPEPDDWDQLRQECCGGTCAPMWPCQVGDANPDVPPLQGPKRGPREIRYTSLFAEQTRELGGITAEAALIARHGLPVEEAE